MKRHILVTGLLVLALGLNAQRTDSDSKRPDRTTSTTKSKDEVRKSSSVKTQTPAKEVSPARPVNKNENKEVRPARESKPEPAYNESRNRETPPARPSAVTRKAEAPTPDSRNNENAKVRTGTSTRTTGVERTNDASDRKQEPERKAGGSTSRESGRVSTENERPVQESRKVGNSKEIAPDQNREYVPRTDAVYVEKRQAYRTPERPRAERTVNHTSNYVYQPVEYRRSYYPYSEPRHLEVIWNVNMYNEYRHLYPQYEYWYYPYGYSIHTVSAYDADRYIGEVARIYGKVFEVWYERNTDEYTLYFGGPYSYQDFSVIVPGRFARRYSYRPERYFTNRSIAVTGLVSLWDERPEMLIKKRSQIEVYF